MRERAYALGLSGGMYDEELRAMALFRVRSRRFSRAGFLNLEFLWGGMLILGILPDIFGECEKNR